MKNATILKTSAAPLAVALALVGTPALAQDAEDTAAPADTIVVTGSITRNPAAATASPIVSVTADDLEKRGVTTVAEAIQSLNANNQGTVPASWSTWGFTTGATAPSLRGFNNAYTLILFDGLRSAVYPLADDAQRNIVDTNTVPSSIVGRIDTLLDGASATYGSDAIAGVINILPKREIEGLHLSGSAGISQRGDAGEQRIAASYGYGNLADNGFNIYGALEYSHNDELYVRDRGYPYNTSDYSRICGTAAQGCLTNGIRNGVQADGSLSFTTTRVPLTRAYDSDFNALQDRYQLLNPDAGCQGLTAYRLNDEQYAANTTAPRVVCQQDLNKEYSMYSPDIERLGATLRGTVALGDYGEAYAMFNYYNVQAVTNITPLSYAGQTAAGGPVATVNRIFLPAYVCAAGTSVLTAGGDLYATGCDATNGTLNPNNPFAADGNQARLYGRSAITRQTRSDTKSYRIAVGASGSIGDSGFDYSIGGTWSKVNLNLRNDGYIYLAGLMDAIAKGTYNFVDPSANTEEQTQSIFRTNRKRASSELLQVQATLAKDVFELPGGMANVAIGGQYRKETLSNPSSNAPNFDDPTERYYSINAVAVAGSRHMWSAAYEVTLPVLDMLKVKALGSYDSYSTGQSAFSPKFEAEFRPVEQIKLRGTWGRGFRIPNLNESFQLPATGYTTAQINCASEIYADFCAQHASNPSYYEGGYSVGLTSYGNPNLKPERSTSMTAGVVFQPTRNVTLTVDYWRTKIKNLIVAVTPSADIYEQYYTNNGVVNLPGVVVRPQNNDPENPGALPLLGFIESSFRNANSIVGKGIDFSANWTLPLSDTITWTSKATAAYLLRLTQYNDDGAVLRYDGTLGACSLTSCSGAPKWRGTWQNTLDFNDQYSFTLTANYTGSYSMVAADSGGTYGDCQQSATDGQLVSWDDGSPVQCRSKRVFYLDGHVEAKVADKFKLYMDVLNILDTKPSLDLNAAYGIYGFNPAWSDRLFVGRYFRVGAAVDF